MSNPENPGREPQHQDPSRRLESGEPIGESHPQGEPGSDAEPRQGQNRPVQEYPGEGVASHFPTEPSTGDPRPARRSDSPDDAPDASGAE